MIPLTEMKEREEDCPARDLFDREHWLTVIA